VAARPSPAICTRSPPRLFLSSLRPQPDFERIHPDDDDWQKMPVSGTSGPNARCVTGQCATPLKKGYTHLTMMNPAGEVVCVMEGPIKRDPKTGDWYQDDEPLEGGIKA